MLDIQSAIEAVYEAFANVPRPHSIQACWCCLTDEQRHQLVSQPLRQLQPTCMSAYGSAAGRSSNQFFYFLPRHFDIAVNDEGWCPQPELIGRDVAEMGLDSCSTLQHNAMEDLFKIIIHKSLDPKRHNNIDPWLCCIAHAGFPVRYHLNAIVKCRSAVLAYFDRNPHVIQKKLDNPFWCLPNPGHEEIVHWFHSRPVRDILYGEYRIAW